MTTDALPLTQEERRSLATLLAWRRLTARVESRFAAPERPRTADDTPAAARVRSPGDRVRTAPRTPRPVMDPRAIEAIEAELMLAVYAARRRARLQLLGHEPAPIARAEALELLRRARRGVPRGNARPVGSSPPRLREASEVGHVPTSIRNPGRSGLGWSPRGRDRRPDSEPRRDAWGRVAKR